MAALASSLFFIAVLAISILTLGTLMASEWERIRAALRGELPARRPAARRNDKPLWDWSRPPRRLARPAPLSRTTIAAQPSAARA